MLEPLKHIINSRKIVLASSSPRRKHILEMIGLRFDVCASQCEENLKISHPADYVLETASLKAMDVADRLLLDENRTEPPDLVIGADTVVVSCEDEIYGKPKDSSDAISMLSRLSGKAHTVYTGVVLIRPKPGGSDVLRRFYEKTEVVFAELSEEVVRAYVATGEPLDKAGGYGIQGIGGSLVKEIHGDYYNVLGFPLHRFCKEMHAIHNEILQKTEVRRHCMARYHCYCHLAAELCNGVVQKGCFDCS